ncbi:MAG: hypothetical protein VXW32_03630 [Myxococcota bacterium]|nr:hypothetical protein [Myxococcota bacterium]
MSLTYIREYREDGGIYSEPNAEPGRPLTELLDTCPPPLRVSLEIGAALADILAIAEEDGKAHGDPKIGMVRVDSEGNIALSDFKPSRRTTRAPEPSPLHPASSIYGLGVILHSLLCTESFGRVPKTEAEHDAAVAAKVELYRFEEAEGQVWLGELKEFLCSMMAYSTQDRPIPDEVADVLGNAADSLEGLPLDVWAERACTDSKSARGRITSAPVEELEGVRAVHQLEPDQETELSGPMLVNKALEEAQVGNPVELLDGSLDETVLDQPSSLEQPDGFAFEETIIDELPVETVEKTAPSIHEEETLVGENLLEKTLPAPPDTPASSTSPEQTPLSEPSPTPAAPPSGVIRGPSLPPPPSPGPGPQSNPAKSALLGLVVVLAVGAGVFLGTQSSDGPSDLPETSPELPGPITAPAPIEAIPEATPPEIVTPEPKDDPAPSETEDTVPNPEPLVDQASEFKAPVAPETAPKPKPATRPSAAPVATPTLPAEPVPAPDAPPYRARITIDGTAPSITCGDGQSPEVAGPLNMTFQSAQFCRVEIEGAMGILNINTSGTFVCSKSGTQVACAKVR